MNLINLLYEPYVIIIFISLIITLIAYFILKNNKDKEDKTDNSNIPKILLYTFIISLILLAAIKYGVYYMNKNNYFQKGGVSDPIDRLTIVADDIDCNILEE